MVTRRSSDVRQGQYRRRHPESRTGVSAPRGEMTGSHPPFHAGADVGESSSSKTITRNMTTTMYTMGIEGKELSDLEHSQDKNTSKGSPKRSATEEPNIILPIDGNTSANDKSSNFVLDCEDVDQDEGGKKFSNYGGKKNRKSRGKSRFPKPPSCRTIQENELIELSGMGRAIPSVILLTELIRNSGFAVKDHIHLSLTRSSENEPLFDAKPRIQIWMSRSELFFSLAAKHVGKETSSQAAGNRKAGTSANNTTSSSDITHSDSPKSSSHEATVECNKVNRARTFLNDEFQTDIGKSENGKAVDERADVDKEAVDKKVFSEATDCGKVVIERADCGNTTNKKDVGENAVYSKDVCGNFDGRKADAAKPVDGKPEDGKAEDCKVGGGKIGDCKVGDGKIEDGKFGDEKAGNGKVGNWKAEAGEANDDQTFLAKAARISFTRTPTSGTNASTGNTTDLPATKSKGSTCSESSANYGMESGDGDCGNTLPDITTNVGTGGGRAANSSAASCAAVRVAAASRNAPGTTGRINASPSRSRPTCTRPAATVSAKNAENSTFGSCKTGLSKTTNKKILGKNADKLAVSKNARIASDTKTGYKTHLAKSVAETKDNKRPAPKK